MRNSNQKTSKHKDKSPQQSVEKQQQNDQKGEQHGGGKEQLSNVPSFLTKTYDIVENPIYDNIICWNESGDGFIVKQPNEFAEKILPKFFKHNNFSSFVRQLNMYDFHKTRNNSNEHCFSHNLFKRGQKKLLVDIKRKNAVPQAEKNMQNFAQNQGMQQFNQYPPHHKYPGAPLPIDQQYDEGSQPIDPYVMGRNPADILQNQQSFGPQSCIQPQMQMMMENPDALRQLQMRMEQKWAQLEEKMRVQDQKLKEYQQTNQNLWQELCKSREREQSLEKLFVLAFTCIAQANGYSLSAPRELMNTQFIGTSGTASQGGSSNSNNSTGRSGSAEQRINSNIERGANNPHVSDQLVLRQENSGNSDLVSLIQRVLNNPTLLNQLLQMTQSGFKGTNQNTSDFFANQGGNIGSQLGSQSTQQNQGLSLIEQLAKGLSGSGNQNIKQNIQQFLSQLDADNSYQPTANNSGTRGISNTFGGPSMNNYSSRTAFTPHQPNYQRINFPQITNQSLSLNSPPNMSPNPYAYDDFDKNSFKNLFQRTVSEYSFDHNNFPNANNNPSITQQRLHVPQPHRVSRTNSIGGHSIANASDDASLFIAKEQAPSEADSDDHRKRLSNELRRAFDQYLTQNQNQNSAGAGIPNMNNNPNNLTSNDFASQHNVEFETLSNSTSNSRLKQMKQLSDANNSSINTNAHHGSQLRQQTPTNLNNNNHSSLSLLGKRNALSGNNSVNNIEEMGSKNNGLNVKIEEQKEQNPIVDSGFGKPNKRIKK